MSEKVAIVGSRELYSPAVVWAVVASLADGDEVLSGGAVGVDSAAVRAALGRGLRVTELLPDYSRFGKAAPLERNKQIAEECDRMVAVWDGSSRGTKHAIDEARKRRKPVRVVDSLTGEESEHGWWDTGW